MASREDFGTAVGGLLKARYTKAEANSLYTSWYEQGKTYADNWKTVRGVLPAATDLDTLSTPQSCGMWGIGTGMAYLNLPAGYDQTQPGTLVVDRAQNYNIVHTLTSRATGQQWVRHVLSISVTPNTWKPWREVAFADAVDSKITAATANIPTVLPLPTGGATHIGDSLTEWPSATNYSIQLAALTGLNHAMEGWVNQSTPDIAARMGAIPTLLSVVSNSIPAVSNAYAQVTLLSVGNPVGGIRQDRRVYGSINGRPGYLWEDAAGVTRFYATAASAQPTSAPSPARFIPDTGDLFGRIVTVWTGANDVWSSGATAEQVVSMQKAIVDKARAQAPQVLVLTVPNRSTYPDGTPTADKNAAINAGILAAFPAQHVDMAGHLMSAQAATDAGIAYTTQDQTDIANGVTPESFRTDNIHFNELGAKAVAAELHRQMRGRGWIL